MEAVDLKKLGIDMGALSAIPPGGQGRTWPPLWRSAIEVLYVNGFTAAETATALGIDINKATIYEWAAQGGWVQKKEAFQKAVTGRSLAQAEESMVDVTKRHLKALKGMEGALLRALGGGNIPAKSLEGVAAALTAVIKAERQVLGLGGAADVTVETVTHNAVFDLDSLDKLPTASRLRAMELYRQKLELDEELNALATGETQVIEGEFTHEQAADPVYSFEASGDEQSPEVPAVRGDDEASPPGA